MKFRKKPVIIEAEQFKYENAENGKWNEFDVYSDEKGYFLLIPTLEGTYRAYEGDWIITGAEGEKYPCKDDIFRLTYEKAEK